MSYHIHYSPISKAFCEHKSELDVKKYPLLTAIKLFKESEQFHRIPNCQIHIFKCKEDRCSCKK